MRAQKYSCSQLNHIQSAVLTLCPVCIFAIHPDLQPQPPFLISTSLLHCLCALLGYTIELTGHLFMVHFYPLTLCAGSHHCPRGPPKHCSYSPHLCLLCLPIELSCWSNFTLATPTKHFCHSALEQVLTNETPNIPKPCDDNSAAYRDSAACGRDLRWRHSR